MTVTVYTPLSAYVWLPSNEPAVGVPGDAGHVDRGRSGVERRAVAPVDGVGELLAGFAADIERIVEAGVGERPMSVIDKSEPSLTV